MRKTIMQVTLMTFMFLSCSVFAAAQATTAPAKMTRPETKKADPAAYDLLRDARSTSQNFPSDFAGFAAEIVYHEDGTVFRGTLDYVPKEALTLKIKGLSEDAEKKLEGDVGSLITHRRGGDFSKGDGKHPITFGADDGSPLGRLVCLNDETQSCYRVRNRQVAQVNRVMGSEKFTINILETTPTPEGKYLPRQFTVTYFDVQTNALKRTQAFTDTYALTQGVWLPVSRRIITSENGKNSVRLIEFVQPVMRGGTAAAR